ncbi:MAG: hypothetical protein AAB426_01175 [Myxococcota bacterium]
MPRNAFLLLSAIVGCAGPVRHAAQDYDTSPTPPRVTVDRRCEEAKPALHEQCALAGNAVVGHAEVLDMYHVQVDLELAETVSGCGELVFTATASPPHDASRQASASVRCDQECMPDGPGGGVCWHVAHGELRFELEFAEPLPLFRPDGTPQPGELSLRITSVGGQMQPVELVVRTNATSSSDADDVHPAPAEDVCGEFNRRQSQLSADEHMRVYGCPPCPCACHNGQITCAPCAACEAFGGRGERVESPMAPGPEGL